ncbi:MAG: 2-amino-4-hydroxy-6-hydroxymethyldihydropteridine diphosphokinase [Candidatus Susulua stagnicola]|nr:2-amino-4-hydroxy-6-hydroxymethyldihydropteridine diphosphokinase [Candidatus Susulua stagnicola]
MRVVFIGLGSNLGNREDYINKAIDYLKKNPNIIVDKISSIIETNPQGFINQGKYLNAVIKLKTSLSAFNLLTELQDIENNLGRVRSFKNAARTIDLDILLYGEEVIDQPGLNVPHPRMFKRKFVMEPLLEIAPELKNKLTEYDYH